VKEAWQKIVVLLIVASAIGMTRLWRNTAPDANASGTVVYATREIEAGSMLRTADLDQGTLRFSQIPQDAVPGGTLAAGRIAKVTIESDQMICLWQLAPMSTCDHYPNYNAEVEKEWASALAKFEQDQ
jgi:flagella basal body P-ring formation protein FlgA